MKKTVHLPSRKTYATGRKRHQQTKLKYAATVSSNISKSGRKVMLTACSSKDMSTLLNETVSPRYGLRAITEGDVRDYFTRPQRNKQLVRKFSCMTGATYSKKKFWLKYYDAEVNPIFMLPPHMDEFVRASYCGGRVECYALGNTIACLTGNRLYYFDVTSPFPFVGLKAIPHGKSCYIDGLATTQH